MRKGIPFMALLAVVCSSFVAGCDSTNDPESDEIDPALIGVWYRVDSLSKDHPSPEVAVTGMQITAEKDYNELGVETNSGRLAVAARTSITGLVSARNGTLVRSYYDPLGGPSHGTFSYQVNGDTLTITSVDFKKTKTVYVRTVIGAQIAASIGCDFKVSFDSYLSTQLKAFEVFPHPASYASRLTESSLLIVADLPRKRLTLEIDDFHGPGDYQLSRGKEVVAIDHDDYYERLTSDSVSDDIITIEIYDEEANLCSGTFSFRIASRFETFELKEGSFSVPIYK